MSNNDHGRILPARKAAGSYKRRLQQQIVGVLLLLFVVWAWLFLPAGLFDSIELVAGKVAVIAARLGIVGSATVIARWIIFAQDSLATGQSKWSTFFRSKFVHHLLSERLSCDLQRAMALWFHFFNRWESGPSEYQQYHRLTFDRTYSCRLVYHLRQWLLYFSLLGGMTLALNRLLVPSFASYTLPALTIVCALSLNLFLGFANRLPTGCSGVATGCWKKYEEIAEIQRVLLEQEVLRYVQTYDEAWDFINDWPSLSAAPLAITSNGRKPPTQ